METIKNLTKEFEKDFEANLFGCISEAYKTNEAKRIVTLDRDKLCLRVFKFDIDVDKNKVIILQKWHFTKEMLMNTDKSNANLYGILTQEEKKAYLARQQYHIDRDDFVNMNIDEELFEYCRLMFKDSFDKYVDLMSNKIFETFIKTKEYTDLIDEVVRRVRLKSSDDEVLNRVKKEYEELKTKTTDLQTFIKQKKHLKLNKYQRKLLLLQLEFMTGYLRTLERRMEYWFEEPEENADTCCSCGKVIPEGQLICFDCQRGAK